MKDFPVQNGKWQWGDIDMLEQSLGYHGRIIYSVIPLEKKNENSICTETLLKLFETNTLHSYVDKTFNHHDGSYNIKVLSKAVELLSQRYISFTTLHLARVSFQTYEHVDHAGVEDGLILRALKLCGKTMAHLKLQQTLRHLNKLVVDRLMFYEYLEIIALADDLSDVIKQVPNKKLVNPKPDGRHLYELCDFKAELSTLDHRCNEYLDDKYQELLKVIPEGNSKSSEFLGSFKESKRKEWITPPLANISIRREMAKKNKVISGVLDTFLSSSNNTVKSCSWGYSCMCTSKIEPLVKPKTTDEPGPVEVKQLETQTTGIVNRMPPILTKEDVEETAHRIQNIQWEMATGNENTKRRIDSLFTNATASVD